MRCIILTGGTVEDLNWLAGIIKKDDDLICVDSGARYAAALGLVPRIIVGDLDSLDNTTLQTLTRQGSMIKEYPTAKDDTDTALALADALAGQPEEIIILGALGTRFDHSLANVHLLQVALERGVPARIMSEYNEISLVAPHRPAVVEGAPGQLFSLLPLTREVTGVHVEGARWPLAEAVFTIGRPYGVSNRLAAGKARISVAAGLLLLVIVNQGAGE